MSKMFTAKLLLSFILKSAQGWQKAGLEVNTDFLRGCFSCISGVVVSEGFWGFVISTIIFVWSKCRCRLFLYKFKDNYNFQWKQQPDGLLLVGWRMGDRLIIFIERFIILRFAITTVSNHILIRKTTAFHCRLNKSFNIK